MIVGAPGNLGQHILKELLQENFNVTVFTRSKGNISYKNNVKVTEADFTSVDSLTTAFQSQDAVISTVGRAGIEGQKQLIDAAVAAGVQRFIPSDFGVCTTSPKVLELPFYSTLATVRQYLVDKEAISPLSYTILASGAFLEYFLMSPNVIDFKNQAVAFIDGGNNRVSTTTMPGIGKAVAGIFNNPDKTKNGVVFVAEAILTQRQVLDFAKEIKPEIKWATSDVK
ncbi:hypothetical protein TARUN_2814 [Trichoderma arundinaceum]|uniref:NmrA-like domain-containing protein n=1 Tax=Trichoderma arundinaceum TaxID=490622 RepID=A0A395NTX4_TRIAR|nr:hypothetical protein TARUN_2814 [Trichoderma arundinaceum]